MKELRQSIRSLKRRPALALTIIATLSIGIGATTAMFSVTDTILLKSLPLPHPDRLAFIQEEKNGESSNGNPQRLHDWAAQIAGIEGATGYYTERIVWTGDNFAEKVNALRSFSSFFQVLGIPISRGRVFSSAEEIGSAPSLVILSERFAAARLGKADSAVGKHFGLAISLV